MTAGLTSTATVTALCSDSPTGYSWWSGNTSGLAPGFSNTSTPSITLGPFTAAGTFTVSVTGRNAVGNGFATGTLTVGATPTPTPTPSPTPSPTPTGCAAPDADYNGRNPVNLNIPQGGTASAVLPRQADGSVNQLRMVQILGLTTSTQQASITVSPCAGDAKSAAPAECTVWGTIWGAAVNMNLYTSSTPVLEKCTLTPGVTYYATVRTVDINGAPSCTTLTCSLALQYN